MGRALEGHYRLEQRSLAMHRAIADKLRANPALLDIAKDNLDRWSLVVIAAAGEKDRDFTRALVRHGMVSRNVLEQRLLSTPVDEEARQRIAARIRTDFEQ